MPAWMTSELREEVSVPGWRWRSRRRVEGERLARARAVARPTAPAPIT